MKHMEDTIFIYQSKYANSIVKKFGLENASHKRTSAATHVKLTKYDNGVDIDKSLYMSMSDCLLYLTSSRHDIPFDVGLCARCQAKPKANNLTQVERIMKHINGTCAYDILYSHDTNSILVGYRDVDWAVSDDDRKSTCGRGCFFLRNKPLEIAKCE